MSEEAQLETNRPCPEGPMSCLQLLPFILSGFNKSCLPVCSDPLPGKAEAHLSWTLSQAVPGYLSLKVV